MSQGTAYFKLVGPFSSGAIGVNSFPITIIDSGVVLGAVFTWTVYSQQDIYIAPAGAELPLLFS